MTQHILIIDDEPSIADNLVYALSQEGFSCEWASLGFEGVDKLLLHCPL